MVFCQDCGKENSAGAKFCESCGASLNTTSFEQNEKKQKKFQNGRTINPTIICKNCGKIYKEDGNCPKCGTYNENLNKEEKTQNTNLNEITVSGILNSFKTGTERALDERKRRKEEKQKIKEEKEQKYQNKKDKRDKTNEIYGFTDDELFRMYHDEARQADKVYKAYITDGISRLEKVNGRFLASQLIKLDVLSEQNNHIIRQNNEIIELLKEIAENTR